MHTLPQAGSQFSVYIPVCSLQTRIQYVLSAAIYIAVIQTTVRFLYVYRYKTQHLAWHYILSFCTIWFTIMQHTIHNSVTYSTSLIHTQSWRKFVYKLSIIWFFNARHPEKFSLWDTNHHHTFSANKEHSQAHTRATFSSNNHRRHTRQIFHYNLSPWWL